MALARLILVTGKGGTGKSAVAAALALWLARRRPTTLVDLDQRMWAARMLGIVPRDHSAVHASPRDGAEAPVDLETISLSAATELEAFIERLVPMKAIARRMLRSRTFGYVTAALPGLEAFLMLERLRLIAGRAALEDRYAVVDAPATGSALELLAVPGALKQIAPLGTLNRLAANVESFIADAARFSVMLTLTPQEMALREALEASDVLRGRLGVNVAAAALNCVPSALFTLSDLEALGAPGADPGYARLAQWRDGAGRFAARARREASRAGLSVVELPMLFSPALGRAELEELSRAFDAAMFAAAPRTFARQPQAPTRALKLAARRAKRTRPTKPPAKSPTKSR
ncbi:MAG TPA: ArsA-related P-loop ATPase [Candidatus Binataceae bacterium]|nr:ArsA-related P-loop ATPase [Candidatus Binataceae bacterium]